MITDEKLKEYMDIWQQEQPARQPGGGHIDEEELYRLAGPGGTAGAGPELLDHLASCPECMEKWVFWSRVQTGDPFGDMAPPVISGGMLKAAASPGKKEAIRIRSGCGRFMLGMLPEIETAKRGLITLEASGDTGRSCEGKTVRVRDASGRIIIEGRFENGRVARPCEDLRDVDLSAWTVVVE